MPTTMSTSGADTPNRSASHDPASTVAAMASMPMAISTGPSCPTPSPVARPAHPTRVATQPHPPRDTSDQAATRRKLEWPRNPTRHVTQVTRLPLDGNLSGRATPPPPVEWAGVARSGEEGADAVDDPLLV